MILEHLLKVIYFFSFQNSQSATAKQRNGSRFGYGVVGVNYFDISTGGRKRVSRIFDFAGTAVIGPKVSFNINVIRTASLILAPAGTIYET